MCIAFERSDLAWGHVISIWKFSNIHSYAAQSLHKSVAEIIHLLVSDVSTHFKHCREEQLLVLKHTERMCEIHVPSSIF